MRSFLFIKAVWRQILSTFEQRELFPALIVSVLGMVTVLALYEYIVYRVILRRALYNRSFNMALAVIPYFIAMIILCLQSNMVITLGTIGALAIIRFRNAVKDPVDLVFLLWSIFIGISCGCRIYSMAILTSLTVTVVLVLLSFFYVRSRSHILVIHSADDGAVAKAEECIKGHSRRYRVKSRNYTKDGVTAVIELNTRSVEDIASSLRAIDEIDRMSLMEYDNDDIL